jgi:elongation factor P
MDTETFEQPGILASTLGDSVNYLKEEMEIKITYYEGETIDIELPLTVILEVVQAETAVRGDTATGVLKKVKLESGLEVSVPGFINVGDKLKIDTRDGSYISRE